MNWQASWKKKITDKGRIKKNRIKWNREHTHTYIHEIKKVAKRRCRKRKRSSNRSMQPSVRLSMRRTKKHEEKHNKNNTTKMKRKHTETRAEIMCVLVNISTQHGHPRSFSRSRLMSDTVVSRRFAWLFLHSSDVTVMAVEQCALLLIHFFVQSFVCLKIYVCVSHIFSGFALYFSLFFLLSSFFSLILRWFDISLLHFFVERHE